MDLKYIAFYGSLMNDRESPIDDTLSSSLLFVQTCSFQGRLYDLGRYPGLKPGDSAVYGELYQIADANVLVEIDAYESADNEDPSLSGFTRKRITLTKPQMEAWIYYYDGAVLNKNLIASGKW